MLTAPEAVPNGALTPTSGDDQAAALTSPGAEESAGAQSTRDYTAEDLLHRIQQREQKKTLFGWGMFISCSMLIVFVLNVYCFETAAKLIEKTPFALVPLSLTGLIPLGILIFLFKSVFGSNGQETLDKKDLELFKEIAAIFKAVTK